MILGHAGADHLSGRGGRDVIKGGAGQDDLFGGSGADMLSGGRGHDALNGGAGRDRLYGGRGHDEIKGGAGADTPTGGSGYDVFVFGARSGHDVIKDFEAGKDMLKIKNASPWDTHKTSRGVLVQFDDGREIELVDLEVRDVDDGIFL